MSKKRSHYSPEEKILILKKQLVKKVPISDIFDAYDLHPMEFLSLAEGIFRERS